MSTDRKELTALVGRFEELGATVTVEKDNEGWITSLQVKGLRGRRAFTGFALTPVSFAEAARKYFAVMGFDELRDIYDGGSRAEYRNRQSKVYENLRITITPPATFSEYQRWAPNVGASGTLEDYKKLTMSEKQGVKQTVDRWDESV